MSEHTITTDLGHKSITLAEAKQRFGMQLGIQEGDTIVFTQKITYHVVDNPQQTSEKYTVENDQVFVR